MHLLQTTAIVNGLLIFAGVLLAAFLLLFVIFVPIGLWISALFSGVFIGPGKMIGMRLRRVAPQIIVNELIKAKKAGLHGIDIDQLEAHHLAQGNVTNVIDALISAKNAGIELNFEEAAGIDLAGRDVLQAVKDSVNPKVIDSPMIEAVAKDGIQLIATARITVRAHLDKLVGGAGEDTVIARVGQGIVAAIGSAEKHEDILAEPGKISERIMGEGLTAGTAYDVLSIDIADIDIGKNIGAMLDAEKAEAELKVAQAKAEEKRAEAVAEEQVYKARVQMMRAKKLESEAEIPNAISDAFRKGNLGVMDYYRMENLEADTGMRRSFADDEGDDSGEKLVDKDES